jgi:hypothetical protein
MDEDDELQRALAMSLGEDSYSRPQFPQQYQRQG